MNVSGQLHVLATSTLKSLIILNRRLVSCQSRSRRFEFENTGLFLSGSGTLSPGYLANNLVKRGNQVFLIRIHSPSLELRPLFKSNKASR